MNIFVYIYKVMSKLIAIVDDEVELEEIYQLMLEELIQSQLIEIKFFADAREFLLWLSEHTPDLVISDLSMPYHSGIDLGQRIRKLFPLTPTYIISGHDESEYKEKLIPLSPCRFLPKPLDPKKLVSSIYSDLHLHP